MTISIARPHGTDIVRGDLRAAVQPADVWDINSTRTPRRHAGNVRTLADSDRKESLTPVSYTHLTLPTNREV